MFESMTYENILESLLRNVPSDVDKREGSIIFDALSPAALEIAQLYIQLDIVLNNAFADTAEREYLILRAKERGIAPYEATRAVMRADFNFITDESGRYSGEIVKEGDKFSLSGFTYATKEQIVNTQENAVTVTDENGNIYNIKKGEVIPGAWKIVCEKAGNEGSKKFGTLLPVKTIQGLTKAVITELIEYGQEAEDTEKFRKRYFDSINSDAFGGNRADYIAKVKAIDGVGQVKVYRAPEGGGTVRVVITDSENKKPSAELVDKVKDILDPVEYEGLGCGIAPIGHEVEVKGVSHVDVEVTAEWQTESNKDVDVGLITEVIENYFKEVNGKWEEKDSLTIYSAQIIARMLDIDGIIDVTKVTLNNSQRLQTGINEIFVFNTLNE